MTLLDTDTKVIRSLNKCMHISYIVYSRYISPHLHPNVALRRILAKSTI